MGSSVSCHPHGHTCWFSRFCVSLRLHRSSHRLSWVNFRWLDGGSLQWKTICPPTRREKEEAKDKVSSSAYQLQASEKWCVCWTDRLADRRIDYRPAIWIDEWVNQWPYQWIDLWINIRGNDRNDRCLCECDPSRKRQNYPTCRDYRLVIEKPLAEPHQRETSEKWIAPRTDLGLIDGLSLTLVDGTGGLQIGLIFGLVGLLAAWFGLGLGYWLLLGLFQGVSSDMLQEHHRSLPNQGIRQSVRNGILFGLISGLVSAFTYILITTLGSDLSSLLYPGLIFTSWEVAP